MLYSWAATVAGSAIMGDAMIGTTIIPVLGPFVTIIRVESEPIPTYLPGGQELLYLSGVLQTSFCIYYITTLLRESHSQQQYGFKVQPTARSLGMKLINTF